MEVWWWLTMVQGKESPTKQIQVPLDPQQPMEKWSFSGFFGPIYGAP